MDTSAHINGGSSAEPGTNSSALQPGPFPEGIHIDLWLRDSEIVDAIREHPEDRTREEYIQTAIKIGVLAIKQAEGRSLLSSRQGDATRSPVKNGESLLPYPMRHNREPIGYARLIALASDPSMPPTTRRGSGAAPAPNQLLFGEYLARFDKAHSIALAPGICVLCRDKKHEGL